MQRLKFSTAIDAPKEDVWRIMLDDAGFREWSSVFQEGSYAVTDWTEGSKALFLTPAGEGMVSRIAVHRPNEFLSIEHRGTVKDGVEDTTSEVARAWAGARESYTIRDAGGGSTLTVEMDVTDEYRSYFEQTWPQALARLKQISERESGASAG